MLFFFRHTLMQRSCRVACALWHILPNLYSLNWRVIAKAGINNFNLSWSFSLKSILQVFFILLFCNFFQFVGIFSSWVIMPWRCRVFDCRGNYDGTPYFPTVGVSLLKYLEDWRRWIDAMPNNRKFLEKQEEIHICHHQFDSDLITVQGGGKRPTQPPTIFPGIPKSCLKQSSTTTKID